MNTAITTALLWMTIFNSVVYCQLPRIQPLVDSAGKGYFADSNGNMFTPRGVNYIRLAYVGEVPYHSTFGPSWDPQIMQGALQSISAYGYNIVRVFIDTGAQNRSNGINGNWTNQGLNQQYMDNIAQFIKFAAQSKVYVKITFEYIPANMYYVNMTNPPNPGITGVNNYYLYQPFINAKLQCMVDFATGLLSRLGAQYMSTIFDYELQNELYFDGSSLPFSEASGSVTTADTLTYDMSDAGERQQCGDANVVHFANSITAAIKTIDPEAMVTVGMFTFNAVGKTGPQGFLPIPGPKDDPRFPASPASLSIWSTLSYLDIHIYPFVPNYNIKTDLVTEEWGNMNFTKPVVLGEFGAYKPAFASINQAAETMLSLQVQSCSYDFSGWLFWTYDCEEQPDFYTTLDDNGAINGVLAPIARPNACVNSM